MLGNYCTAVIEFVYDTYKKRLQYCKHVAMQEYGILSSQKISYKYFGRSLFFTFTTLYFFSHYAITDIETYRGLHLQIVLFRLSVASVTNSNETKSREMNMAQFSASWVLGETWAEHVYKKNTPRRGTHKNRGELMCERR
jgi:hypothetical protein